MRSALKENQLGLAVIVSERVCSAAKSMQFVMESGSSGEFCFCRDWR